jgi:hypothetical protein
MQGVTTRNRAPVAFIGICDCDDLMALTAHYQLINTEFLVSYACPTPVLDLDDKPLTSMYVAKNDEVGAEGIEPSCSEAAGFKPAVSTGFTTRPARG